MTDEDFSFCCCGFDVVVSVFSADNSESMVQVHPVVTKQFDYVQRSGR